MRFLTPLLLLAAQLAAFAQNPNHQVHVGGQKYARLSQWAQANAFQGRWLVKEKELELTGHHSRLLFSMDSRRMQINHVTVFLAEPVLLLNGSVLIAAVDLEATLHPVLFPPRHLSKTPIKTICLDPGHGGKDPGAVQNGHSEKHYTLLLAEDLARQLRKAGLEVIFTRATDLYLEPVSRIEFANSQRADLFVSLHFNSAASHARGIETYCMTPAGSRSSNASGSANDVEPTIANHQDVANVLLAYQIQRTMLKELSAEDRGVRRARFAVLREARMPAVLIEGGFLSNAEDAGNIANPTYRRRMAKSIADGLLTYKQLVE